MYREEVTAIAADMKDDLSAFKRGILFAICSIRQPIASVPEQLSAIAEHGGDCEALAMPMKWHGWRYVEEHGAALRADILQMNDRDALVRLLAVPSLGLVKAGFVLQFLGRNIGCLDTHNLKRLGVPMRAFAHNGHVKGGFSSRAIDHYFSLAGGRAEELWNDWCCYVAKRDGVTAEEISRIHLAICN